MTNKEAIQILKTSAWLREDEERSTKRHMAIDMAIEALSCSEIPNGSDAVSRQAAIDAVQNEVEPFVVIEPGTNCVIGAGVKDEDVIRVLEHLPSAEPEQQWIPCSDRFPESNGFYIVTTIKAKDIKQVGCTFYSTSNGWEFYGCEFEKNIVAWMPLPECYRGEQDE